MVTDSDNRIRLAPVSEGVHRPLWSVMIPTFHCARFLHQMLESMLSQATSTGVQFDWRPPGRQWSGARTYAQCEPSVKTQLTSEVSSTSIQQGLANGSPDVDAVWRLILDRNFAFSDGAPVVLEAGNWSPFNTQSTWWWPIAYPLLYLPSYCSFRTCDIWKSFIAQRCLWEL